MIDKNTNSSIDVVAVGLDTNHDKKMDAIVADINGDGIPDAVGMDTNNDGKLINKHKLLVKLKIL